MSSAALHHAPRWVALRPAIGVAVAVALGVAAATPAAAQEQSVPAPTGWVNDRAELLSATDRFRLNQRLGAYERETGHQFLFLSVVSLEDEPIEDFSIRVAEAWKLGDAERDDGLILLMVKEGRKARIEVGSGLEGAIPDVTAKRILDQVLKGRGNTPVSERIFATFDRLMKAAEGEAVGASPTLRDRPRRRGRPGGTSMLWLILVAIAIPFLVGRLRSGSGGTSAIGAVFGFMWGLQHGFTVAIIAAILGGVLGIFFIGGGGFGGGFGGYGGGGFGGGGFGGGGFGGGGFGGGGGGDFSGGGASGDW